MVVEKTLREKLTDVIETLPAESVTLAIILDMLGREGYLLLTVLLTLPFMAPVSIPGVSTIFGAVILLIGLNVMIDRELRLPDRFMKRAFPAGKLRTALGKGVVWLHRLERISRPRLSRLSQGSAMARLNGFMLVIGALLLMVPFGPIPLTNTLPGLAVLFLSVGILQRDGGFILLGYLTNLVTVVYFTQLVTAGSFAVREGIERFFPLLSSM
jgi:hypothetical protein